VIARLRRSPKPPPEDELFARVIDDSWAACPPNHLEIARILLEQVEYLEYVASRASEAAILADANRDSSADAIDAALRWSWREKEAEQRELLFESLWTMLRLGIASAEEEAVEREVERILRKRRQQEAEEASEFRRELGRLPEQDSEQQRRTIADWVRMGRKAGIVPPRPARPKGLPRRAPDS
jgi:hypothetical protein